jgi:hypothetical protein
MHTHTRGNLGSVVSRYRIKPKTVTDPAMNTYLMTLRVRDIHRTRGPVECIDDRGVIKA